MKIVNLNCTVFRDCFLFCCIPAMVVQCIQQRCMDRRLRSAPNSRSSREARWGSFIIYHEYKYYFDIGELTAFNYPKTREQKKQDYPSLPRFTICMTDWQSILYPKKIVATWSMKIWKSERSFFTTDLRTVARVLVSSYQYSLTHVRALLIHDFGA